MSQAVSDVKLGRAALAVFMGGVLTPLVLAHEGHGNPHWSSTAARYLLEPLHAWPSWVVVAVVIALVVRRRRRPDAGRSTP